MGRRAVRSDSEPRARVRLRVEVDQEHAFAGLGEAGADVHGGRRLPDAALLVRHCVDPGGHERERIGGLGRRSAGPGQARGRFFAMPGRRGNPGGVGPDLADHEKPFVTALELGAQQAGDPRTRTRRRRSLLSRAPRSHPPRAAERRARMRRVASRAPWRARRRTRRRAAPPLVPRRPARWGARRHSRSRNSHFLRCDSTSVTDRSGSATASGIPGEPPPEPRSTIVPLLAATIGRARSASSSRTFRASSAERNAVSPGVATTSSSQRSSTSLATVAPQSAKWRGSTTT